MCMCIYIYIYRRGIQPVIMSTAMLLSLALRVCAGCGY